MYIPLTGVVAAAEDDTAAALAESLLGEDFHAVELTANDLFGGVGASGASAFGTQTASAQTNSSAVVESTSSVQSDEIGNIIDVDGMEFVWEGRQLQSIGANGTPYFSYEYNIDGQRTKKTVTDFDTGETTTTEYFYNGSTLAGQKTGSDVLVFMYDESGDMFGFTYNGTPYYYVKNAQNDVWAVTNADGQAVVLYFYDAWGDVAKRYEADGYEAIAEVNPILYRSYYCDLELGFYYLNTRYYAPTLHRFLNADGLIDNRSVNSQNLFSYCANNPTNYTDSSGQAWYHWALAATIVVGCAIAVVATAGGAAAGIAAVASVASGCAAATTAATVAAGAFIGSSVALGVAAIGASMTSSSAKDFADKGNWGTVAGTAAGAAVGGIGGYGLSGGVTKTPVIGKMRDLNKAKIKIDEFKVADFLPDLGSPKANWQQNSSVLRSFLDGRPIKDVSPYPMENAGFLGAERNLLMNQGYIYENGYWVMP